MVKRRQRPAIFLKWPFAKLPDRCCCCEPLRIFIWPAPRPNVLIFRGAIALSGHRLPPSRGPPQPRRPKIAGRLHTDWRHRASFHLNLNSSHDGHGAAGHGNHVDLWSYFLKAWKCKDELDARWFAGRFVIIFLESLKFSMRFPEKRQEKSIRIEQINSRTLKHHPSPQNTHHHKLPKLKLPPASCERMRGPNWQHLRCKQESDTNKQPTNETRLVIQFIHHYLLNPAGFSVGVCARKQLKVCSIKQFNHVPKKCVS